MRRRAFMSLIGGAAVWPLAARAQQAAQVRRIGVLVPFAEDHPVGQARVAAFLQGLRQLGWTDGSNVRIDYRWSAGDADRSRKFATELIALGPDVVMAFTSAAGDQHRSDRVCGRRRPGRRRLCRKPGAAGRQHDRLCRAGIWGERKID
jgi:ABC-type uncharacterized transport system substrate-binding protein